MATIRYNIDSGTAPFTAGISPAVAGNNVHQSTGSFYFTNIPDGEYVISIVDSENCSVEFGVTVSCDVTTTVELTTTNEITTTETPTTTVDPLYNCVEYGYLYNWYVIDDVRELTSADGWYVPARNDIYELADYLGAGGNYSSNTIGGKLKETGTEYWLTPNTGATNEYGFNARGSGIRIVAGTYQAITESFAAYCSDNSAEIYTRFYQLNYNGTSLNSNPSVLTNKKSGYAIRLVSDAIGVTDGTTTTYVGNDGKTYSAIAINELYWTQYNLAETEYRNGDPIPTVEDATTWAGLTTGAKCAYDNNYEYVGCGETAPVTTTSGPTTTEQVTTTGEVTTTESPTTTEAITTTNDITTTVEQTTTEEVTTTAAPEPTYFVSSTEGSDSNDGLSELNPWETLDKVNATTFSAGDFVAFKRGDSWEGTLTVGQSGTSGNPITFGAYGTGDKPKIYGSEVITGWTLHSGNIWKATVTDEVYQLFIDEEQAQLARYPKTGYFKITTVNSATQFISTDLTSQSADYYNGATIMIKGLIYELNRRLVTDSDGQTISINTAPNGNLGYNKGFFMVDKLEFLTEAGEWCYDPATKTLYAWMPNNNSPENYEIRGSIFNDGFYIPTNTDDIVIRDLEILHQSKNGIYMYNADRIEIKNNDISKCQQAGIFTSTIGNILTIDGNNISDCYMRGIYIGYGGSQGRVIANNIINNIGRISLIGRTISTSLASPGTAIASMSGNTNFTYNKITNVGYIGIYFNTGVCNITHNYLNNTMLEFNDGAAVYSYAGNYLEEGISGSVISNNIILNTHGSVDGQATNYLVSFGVYFDDKIHDVTIENNLIAMSSGGINFNGGGRNIFRFNTLFDCLVDINSSIQVESNTVENNLMYKVNRAGNLPSYPTTNQRFVIQSGNADNNFDFNTYIAPYSETNVFTGYANFSAWQTAGNDLNATYDGTDMTEGYSERLFYNENETTKTYFLNGATNITDAFTGASVTTSFTLQPFTGKALIGEDVNLISDTEDVTTTI